MFDADDFATDPLGHIGNQAAHGQIVGVCIALLCLTLMPPWAAPIVVALVYGIVWEVLIQPQPKGWADSIMDTACVMGGASVLCGAFHFIPGEAFWQAWRTVAVAFLAYGGLVLLGGLRRWK